MPTQEPNYFDRDARALAKAARDDPEVIFRIIVMVLLSIRQPWSKVPQQFEDVINLNGVGSKYLFGFKRLGYGAAYEYKGRFRTLIRNYDGDLENLIQKLMIIPGLGLAKASFVAQMLVNDGACLDSHNLSRIGLTPNFTRIDKNVPKDIIRGRIHEYNTKWREYGDSAYWWNSWCENLARSGKFNNASEVSAIHRLPLL